MDPLTIIAAGSLFFGLGALGLRVRKQSKRAEMRDAIAAPIQCGDDMVLSLFDVFWDLGADEFTLEMLAHRGLLLENADELAMLITKLPASIAEHGGYKGFVDDLLVAIEEYRISRRPTKAGRRLETPERKLLPLPRGAVVVDSDAAQKRQNVRAGETGDRLVGEVEEQKVDIDEVLETDALDLIASLFVGAGTQKVKRWFALRTARKLREELDAALGALYRKYQIVLRETDKGLDHLYHQGKQWDAEGVRLAMLAKTRSWRKEDWADCADALVAKSEVLCRSLSAGVGADTDTVLARIDRLAKSGDSAMAGYLVFLNRYAFFAGKLAECESPVREIETATHRLRQELRECRRKGMI